MGTYTSETYQDAGGEWRWRLRERNGQVVAVSGEGYVNKAHAEGMVGKLFGRLEEEIPAAGAVPEVVVGTVTRVGEFEVLEHQITLEPEFDERLNRMPAGTTIRLYAAPVRDLTQQQLRDAAAMLAAAQKGGE